MRSKIAQRILNETPEEVKVFVRLYADITIRVHDIMKRKGINQRELAEAMDKKPSEINKWLKGEHNFTLRSLAKLQVELGEELIQVPKKEQAESLYLKAKWRVEPKKQIPRVVSFSEYQLKHKNSSSYAS